MLQDFYPFNHAKSVFTIDYAKLYDMGYRGLVFDIDNTLVHHGDDSTPQVDQLFADLHQMGFSTLLLSNNDQARVLRFLRNIDSLYVCDAEKPEVAGYIKALDMLGLPANQVLVIGDQLFKDILGANRVGLASILVDFIRQEGETKLGKTRRLEQVVLEFYRRDRSLFNRLGDIQKR